MLLLTMLFVADNGCKTLVPTTSYESRSIAGFTVRVNRALDTDPVGKAALAVLEARLLEVNVLVAQPALSRLRDVPIWIGVDDGTHPQTEYHPSATWLREHGCNPDKAKAVEIGNARFFLDVRRSQPKVVIHELAHAYRDVVLGKDPRLTRLYRAAAASKRYDAVLHDSGVTRRHYGMADESEYFAEGTEAFFGGNDFYPFVRAELRAHDPALFAFLEDVWGKVDPNECTLRIENATRRPITIFWRDFSGKLKRYATIDSQREHTQKTFLGHHWIATHGDATVSEHTAQGDFVWRVAGTSTRASTPRE